MPATPAAPQGQSPAAKPAAGARPAAGGAQGGRGAAAPGQPDLRGMNYAEGRQAVRPGGGMPAMPQSGTEAMQLAQRSVRGGSAGATLTEGQTAYQDKDIQVSFDAGSRMTARLGYGGLSFSTQPGILVQVNNAPDVRIQSVRYNFDEGRFTADVASDGFDLFGVIGKIGKWKVEQVLDAKLKPLLPAALQRPGYSPQRDPDLPGTLGQMQRMFDFAGGAGAAAGGAGGMAGKLSKPSASLDVAMPEELRVPLGDSGLELLIEQGTSLNLNAQGEGAAAQPTLSSLSLMADGRGIRILPSEGMFKEFKELNMRAITIRPGGQFSFDYDLSAEGLISGLAGLVQLLGMAAGQPVSGNVPDVKLDFVRKEIDAKLQSEVPPRFAAFVKQYDGLVPGFSLSKLFAV